MKTTGQPAAPQDAALFRQAMDGVTPLPPSGRHHHRPAPRHPASRADDFPPPADILSDPNDPRAEPPTEFLRPGVSRATLLKLRRGKFPPQASLDLHGCNSDEARKQLPDFLRQARGHGLRHVTVIHGKGWNSAGGEGVLKTRVRHWLTQCTDALEHFRFNHRHIRPTGNSFGIRWLKSCQQLRQSHRTAHRPCAWPLF